MPTPYAFRQAIAIPNVIEPDFGKLPVGELADAHLGDRKQTIYTEQGRLEFTNSKVRTNARTNAQARARNNAKQKQRQKDQKDFSGQMYLAILAFTNKTFGSVTEALDTWNALMWNTYVQSKGSGRDFAHIGGPANQGQRIRYFDPIEGRVRSIIIMDSSRS